jgi:hypothetical protein
MWYGPASTKSLGAQTSSTANPLPKYIDPSVIKGDANGDGSVNITDVAYVIDYINGTIDPGFVEAAADVNGDGEINITDVALIIDIINGVN